MIDRKIDAKASYVVLAVLVLAVVSTGTANAKPQKESPGGGKPSSAPAVLSFDADRKDVEAGGTVLLSWASENTKTCSASGAWEGKQPGNGSYRTQPLTATTSFTLKCNGGGGVQDTVTITVANTAPPPEEPAPEATPEPPPTPVTVTLAAEPSSIVEGEMAMLTWSSSGASTCQASGDWFGGRELSGSEYIAGLSTHGSFQIECSGDGGVATASASISVAAPATEATLNLWAAETSVYEGAGTALSWFGEAVSNCRASGSWSGPRATTGEEFVGPIYDSQNYQLTCDGPDGPIVAMTTVAASAGGVSVSWVPPSENVDGSPLGDLLEYRIYVGVHSGTYQEIVNVPDPAATSHFLSASPGDYYLAVTAVDIDGNESAFSNEVLKTVR
jgi:hypothetical protein